MNFLLDKQIRHFIDGLIFCSCSCLFFVFLTYVQQKYLASALIMEQNQAFASYLLEQDVSPEQIANAITNSTISEDGILFVKKLGISQSLPSHFLPLLANFLKKAWIHQVLQALFLLFCIWGNSILFLKNRESLYQNAIQIIALFNQENFTKHLPRLQEGTLYRLFASIEHLASTLQAKIEIEQHVKEFLRDTISDISHQLKTPLSALQMYHEIIQDESDNPKIVSEFSLKTGSALSRMEELIQSLLKITRLDAGNITFNKKLHSIKDLISYSLDPLIIRAEMEQKELLIEGKPVMVFCDFQWSSEAITNLVKNALDHTKPGGKIQISWEQTPVLIRIMITDNGTGILPEDFHHIFKRFYRSKNSMDSQGLGLGLSLAKSIIEGQHGILSVQSIPLIGTTFTISLLTKM